NKEVRKGDFRLEEGLVLAVEPMVNIGTADTVTLRDHWTVVTKNGLPSAHVEHTLAVTAQGVYRVTAGEETPIPRLAVTFPPWRVFSLFFSPLGGLLEGLKKKRFPQAQKAGGEERNEGAMECEAIL